jgi:hypothetical protein
MIDILPSAVGFELARPGNYGYNKNAGTRIHD